MKTSRAERIVAVVLIVLVIILAFGNNPITKRLKTVLELQESNDWPIP